MRSSFFFFQRPKWYSIYYKYNWMSAELESKPFNRNITLSVLDLFHAINSICLCFLRLGVLSCCFWHRVWSVSCSNLLAVRTRTFDQLLAGHHLKSTRDSQRYEIIDDKYQFAKNTYLSISTIIVINNRQADWKYTFIIMLPNVV